MNIQDAQAYQETILANISDKPKDLFDLMEGMEAWADWEAEVVCKYMLDEGFIDLHSKGKNKENLYVSSASMRGVLTSE